MAHLGRAARQLAAAPHDPTTTFIGQKSIHTHKNAGFVFFWVAHTLPPCRPSPFSPPSSGSWDATVSVWDSSLRCAERTRTGDFVACVACADGALAVGAGRRALLFDLGAGGAAPPRRWPGPARARDQRRTVGRQAHDLLGHV